MTVITPSYNQGAFIEQAIHSLLAQTYRNFEHIIVDGGSKDGTAKTVERYLSAYNVRWISEPDSGMYHAINKGMRLANGEIIAYLNCDDMYLPWTLSLAVKSLQGSGDLLFSDAIRCDADLKNSWLHFLPPFGEMYYRAAGVIIQPTVFFKKSVLEAIGPFDVDNYNYISDCDFWLRAIEAGFKFKKINEFCAIQRDHPATLSSRNRAALKEEFQLLRKRYANGHLIHPVMYNLWGSFYCRLALMFFKAGFCPVWENLRASPHLELSWSSCFRGIFPANMRGATTRSEVIDLPGLVCDMRGNVHVA